MQMDWYQWIVIGAVILLCIGFSGFVAKKYKK